MNYSPSQCKGNFFPADDVKQRLKEGGAVAVGVAEATEVDAAEFTRFQSWLTHSHHATMDYMTRYTDIRRDPRLLLDGARSLIVAAFPYYHSDATDSALRYYASYAHGDDYHELLRSRLQHVASYIKDIYGGETRICVDTAPLLERYWAERAGVGFVGRNHQLIVPGAGSYCFIATILSTIPFTPDTPSTAHCAGCNRCITACPGKALTPVGLDARRCLSYLTIEHRGDLPEGTDLCGHLYGCDVCQQVCPHNRDIPSTTIPEFLPRPALRNLNPDAVLSLTQADFSAIMRHSPIKRTKLTGLQRNATLIQEGPHPAVTISYSVAPS